MKMSSRSTRCRGGALLTVLWLSAALAAISFSLASSVRAEIERSSTNADGLRAWYLATGSVDRGIQWMLWGPAYRNPDGSAQFWEPNRSRLPMRYPSGDAIVEMIPEMAKLNINTVDAASLSRLIQVISNDPMRAQLIAGSIVDWRSGSPASAGPGLDPFSLGSATTFPVPHASFQEIEELLLVRGMTPELFYGNYVADSEGRLYASGGLRDCLSVWGSNGPYDVNTVSPALMMALGLSPATVNSIVERRRVQPFRSMGEVGTATPSLGIGGNVIWTLRATARLRDASGRPLETVRTASATVKLVNPKAYLTPVHVLRWYDDAWSQSALAPPNAFQLGVARP
jgi:general secretion pathway protein K